MHLSLMLLPNQPILVILISKTSLRISGEQLRVIITLAYTFVLLKDKAQVTQRPSTGLNFTKELVHYLSLKSINLLKFKYRGH